MRIGRRGARILAIALAAIVWSGPAPGAADAVAARGQVTDLPLPRFVSIRANTANARRGPGLTHRVDWEFVRRGLPVEVVAEYGQWRRVRDVDGYGGWVHHTLLSGARTGLVVGDAPVELHTGPNAATALRALAEPGVVGRISACEGAWCELRLEGARGWVPRDRLWGVGPDEEFD